MKAVFDTNILIDYLNGIDNAKSEIDLYTERYISVITVIETLVGASTEEEETAIRRFLSTFRIKELSQSIAEISIQLRKENKLKVPDAIVYGTAKDEGCILVTRNTKDMKRDWPDIRVPYT